MAKGKACAVKGCYRLAAKRGWCLAHYGRWIKTGDVRAELPVLSLGHRRGWSALKRVIKTGRSG